MRSFRSKNARHYINRSDSFVCFPASPCFPILLAFGPGVSLPLGPSCGSQDLRDSLRCERSGFVFPDRQDQDISEVNGFEVDPKNDAQQGWKWPRSLIVTNPTETNKYDVLARRPLPARGALVHAANREPQWCLIPAGCDRNYLMNLSSLIVLCAPLAADIRRPVGVAHLHPSLIFVLALSLPPAHSLIETCSFTIDPGATVWNVLGRRCGCTTSILLSRYRYRMHTVHEVLWNVRVTVAHAAQ